MESTNFDEQLAPLISSLREWGGAGVLSPQETKAAVQAVKRVRRAYNARNLKAVEQAFNDLLSLLLQRRK